MPTESLTASVPKALAEKESAGTTTSVIKIDRNIMARLKVEKPEE
ncbi:hypothetical protein GCM10028895_03940 [Pontibacter rugosus]